MKLVAHTGPTAVKEVADGLRKLGVPVTCEGTEHVYIEVTRDTADEATRAIAWVLNPTPLRWLRFRAV